MSVCGHGFDGVEIKQCIDEATTVAMDEPRAGRIREDESEPGP